MKVSVVIPVYNSAKSIAMVVNDVLETFKNKNYEVEFVLVDDGSKDESWKIIEKLAQANKFIKSIKLKNNFGQHNALLCGLQKASGAVIVTIDDDGQHPPQGILKLLKHYEQHQNDIVYGVFNDIKSNAFRISGSYFVQFIFKMIFGRKTNFSPFRLIAKPLQQRISDNKTKFIFMDGLLQSHTSNIDFISVAHKERAFGKSGYSIMKLLKLTSNLVFTYSNFPSIWLVLCLLLFSIVLVFPELNLFIENNFDVSILAKEIQTKPFKFLLSFIFINFAIGAFQMKRSYERKNKSVPYLIDKEIE